jgi:hypothetical protein
VRTVAATRAARQAGTYPYSFLEISFEIPSGSATSRRTGIYEGPPTAILQVAHPRRSENSPLSSQPYPPGVLGDSTRQRENVRRARRVAQDAVEVATARARLSVPSVIVPSLARTRVRAPRPPDPGWRKERDEPLTVESVLVTNLVPPVMTTDREHQTCGICLHIKSHPVAYVSGSSQVRPYIYFCSQIPLWSQPLLQVHSRLARNPLDLP